MNLEGCIFDLDGVIVDTAKFHLKAWNKMANKFDYVLKEEDNANLKGVGRMASLDYILQLAGVTKTQEQKTALAKEKNEFYLNLIDDLNEDDILPGVRDFLELLKLKNISIALGSASKNARAILFKLNLTSFFDCIIDGTDVTKTKPDPEVFLRSSEKLDIKPECMVVFEDAVKGIQAAKAGGFKVIGVGIGDELEIADYVIQDFSDFSFIKMNNLFSVS